MWCIAQGKPKHVRTLLKFGADASLSSQSQDGTLKSALIFAYDSPDPTHLQYVALIACCFSFTMAVTPVSAVLLSLV